MLVRAGGDDATAVRRLAAAVSARTLPARGGDDDAGVDDSAADLAPRAPERAAPGPGAPGAQRAYGAALYRAAGALRPCARGEAVEVCVRRTADGGRLAVARRTDGPRTVAIEAQIA